jgi:hypothetical protein
MDLRPELQIQAVIKALEDVILPAIDADNTLAVEQGYIAANTLKLALKRQPMMYRYDCDELAGFLELASTLKQEIAGQAHSDELLNELSACIGNGRSTLSRAQVEPVELEQASFQLRDSISKVIKAYSSHCSADQLKAVGKSVVSHAQRQITKERAWVVDLGWDIDPESLPDIGTLLAEVGGKG